MSRFDPIPDAAYGYCLECDEKFMTQALADAHMTATLEACQPDSSGCRTGHSVRVGNPPRDRRIKRAVESELEDALYEFFSEIERWLANGELTEKEVRSAMRGTSVDMGDEWEEHYDA